MLDNREIFRLIYVQQLSSRSGFVRILDGGDCGAELIHIFHQQTPLVKRTIYGTANAMIVVLAEPGEHGATFNATVSFNSLPSTGNTTVPLQV
ncbi:unnamed protein product [Dicrocoelium dendriticum]|nr:unnamed protein product [Dicrocoelium dendriticum]